MAEYHPPLLRCRRWIQLCRHSCVGRLPMPVSFADDWPWGAPALPIGCQRPSVSAAIVNGQFCHAITTARRIL